MLSLCLQRREEILFFLMSPLLPCPPISDLMSLHSCFTESLNFPFRIIHHSIFKKGCLISWFTVDLPYFQLMRFKNVSYAVYNVCVLSSPHPILLMLSLLICNGKTGLA